MERIKYLMVTHWDNHWDNLKNDKTYYPKTMLKGIEENNLEDKAPTIFIKLDKTSKRPEKAWVGQVYDFEPTGDKIWFKVKIKEEKPLNDLPKKFLSTPEGWYLIETEISKPDSILTPPLFDDLKKKKNPLFLKNTYIIY